LGILKTVPTPHQPPQNIDELLRIIAARDSEVALLKLMVDKLKLQLLRRVRSEFGTSSEQWSAQMPLIDGGETAMVTRAKAASAPAPANDPQIDRSLPAHLPRDVREHLPEISDTHQDTNGQLRIPRHRGHHSTLMAGSVPRDRGQQSRRSRAAFHLIAGTMPF